MAHQSENDLNVGRIALISLISVLLTVALVLFLLVLFYWFQEQQLTQPQYNQLNARMANYVADQKGKLVSIRVVDKERRVVTIPIETAMQLVIDELSADPRAEVTGVPPAEPPAEQTQPRDDGAPDDGSGDEPGDAGTAEGDADSEAEDEPGGASDGPVGREEGASDVDS